eukprot:1159218-Pelagomonas_calceolata.AAC.7
MARLLGWVSHKSEAERPLGKPQRKKTNGKHHKHSKGTKGHYQTNAIQFKPINSKAIGDPGM